MLMTDEIDLKDQLAHLKGELADTIKQINDNPEKASDPNYEYLLADVSILSKEIEDVEYDLFNLLGDDWED